MKSMLILSVLISLSMLDFNLTQKTVHAENLQYEGRLEPAFAIGGETTGIGFRSRAGEFLEIKGSDEQIHQELLRLVVIRANIKISGYFTTIRGIEIPQRKVLLVQEYSEIK